MKGHPMKDLHLFPSILALAALAATAATSLAADLRLSPVFGDHMVLQRDKPVKVWGWADSGEKITVEFAGQRKTAKAAKDGTWQVVLDPMSVSAQGRTLTVQSKIITNPPALPVE
jgi:sialate O-acetylesterase